MSAAFGFLALSFSNSQGQVSSFSPKEGAYVETQISKLQTCNPVDRKTAAVSLAALGERASRALTALEQVVKQDPDPTVRAEALQAISKISGPIKDDRNEKIAAAEVLKLVAGSDPIQSIRIGALQSLASGYGIIAPNSYEELRDTLKNHANEARTPELIASASRIILAKVKQLRQTITTDSNVDNRNSAAREVLAIVRRILPEIESALRLSQPEVRIGAALTLAETSYAVVDALAQITRTNVALQGVDYEYLSGAVDEAKEAENIIIRNTLASLLKELGGLDKAKQGPIVEAVLQIGNTALLTKDSELLAPLDQAENDLRRFGYEPEANDLHRAAKALSEDTFIFASLRRLRAVPLWLAVVLGSSGILIAILLLGFLMFPVLMVSLSEKLTFNGVVTLKLPQSIGGPTISFQPQYLLLLGMQYRARALNAWVRSHSEDVRTNFEKNQIRDRNLYVPTEITLDKTTIPQPKPSALQDLFKRNQARLVIYGEGGTGKTTLAKQIIRWSMHEKAEKRICPKHSMIPVLLQPDSFDGEPNVLKSINVRLSGLIDATELLSEKLVKSLLKKKHILVVIDGFSELSAESRAAITNSISEIPINALIVTSRKYENLNEQPRSVIHLKQMQDANTLEFIAEYVKLNNKNSLFQDQSEYINAQKKLSKITAERGVTVLLARIYADQMISIKEAHSGILPDNIPDLIESNISSLHRRHEFRTETVLSKLEIIAWECLQETLNPKHVKRVDVLSALGGGKTALHLLSYLENELKLIKTDELPSKISFTLDPVAEYLAALYLVKNYQSEGRPWRELIDRLSAIDAEITASGTESSIGLDSIKGFLFALRDCCVTKGKENQVPIWVINSVTEFADKATIYELIADLEGNVDEAKVAKQKLISFGEKSVRYLKKAAESGNPHSQDFLDEMWRSN